MYTKFIQRKWLLGSLLMVAIFGLVTLLPGVAKATVEPTSPVTIFSDGFESEDFDNWTSAGANWLIEGSGADSSSDKAVVLGAVTDSVLKKSVSTSGYGNISLSYSYQIIKNLEDDDHVFLEWSDNSGITWHQLADYTKLSTNNNWISNTVNLPVGANNNANFQFKFRATLNSIDGNDKFGLDNISLIGTLDTISPIILSHENMTVPATAFGGAMVAYLLPTATDNLDSNVTVNCDKPSGSVFAMGLNTVTCNAHDTAGNNAIQTNFTITVVPGSVSASNSIVSTNPGPAVTDAGTSYMITVTAKDQYDNVIPGILGTKVILSSNGTNNTFSQPSLATDINGQTTGQISSTKAEVKIISCAIDGVLLTNTATLSFVPGAFNHIIITPSSQNIIYGDTYNFSAQGYDANNNPVSGLTYAWTKDNGTGSGTVDNNGLFTTAGAGTVTIKATSGSITGTANVVITPRPITITADAKTKVYGTIDPALTYQITSGNLVYGDVFSGFLARTTGENIGNYAINQNTLALSPNYALTYAGADFTITKAGATVSATADNKIYDGTTEAVPHLIVSGAVNGDILSATSTSATFADKNVGIGKTVTVSGITLTGTNAGNYSFNTTAITSADISQRAITVTAATDEKEYDATTSSSVGEPTITDGDLSISDSVTWTQTFDNKNVGTGRILIPAGTVLDGNNGLNYNVAFVNNTTGVITPKDLVVTATGVDKVYDGTTVAAVNLLDDRIIGDVLTASYANASFADVNIGTGKAVSVSGITIAGTDAGNYSFNPTASASADITPLEIKVIAEAKTKVYGSLEPVLTYTFSPVLISGDSFTGSLNRDTGENIGEYAINKNTLALSSNYILTYSGAKVSITRAVAIVSATADNKIYDGTTEAVPHLIVSGAVNGDILSATSTSATFADKNVGIGKTVTVSGITLTGTNAGNYSFNTTAITSADISQRAITVTAATDEKEYDATTSSSVGEPTITDGDLSISDSVTWTQTFDNKNVGTCKSLIPSGIVVDGNNGNNYNVTFVNNNTGKITVKTLTINAAGVNKVYDGTANATVTLSDDRIVGDVLTASYANASFADANAGNNKTVSVSGITISGADAGNYIFNTTEETSADITPLEIAVNAVGKTKVYGTTDPELTYTFSPALIGDDEFSGSLARDEGEDVGTYAINHDFLVLSSNYSIDYTGANLIITKANPILTWTSPVDVVAGTSLSNTQLNATANIPGTFNYDPAVGTQLQTVGTYPLSVDFVPTDSLNYNSATIGVNISVYPAPIAKILISAPSSIVTPGPAIISITGKDQYNNIVTNDSLTNVVLSTDNGAALSSTILTLNSGLANADLTKNVAGLAHVTAVSGALSPVSTSVTFTAADTSGPVVTQINPLKDAENVAISSPLFLIFNEPLKSESISSANIKLMKVATGTMTVDEAVSASVSLSEGDVRVNINPNSSLDFSSQYYFVVSGVADKTGNVMTAEIGKENSGFTTAADTADHIAPTVVAVWPSGSAVEINVNPYVDFSETMKLSTLTEENIRLFKVGSTVSVPAVVVVQNGGTRVEIQPVLNLDYETAYYISVSANVSDEAGNKLSADYVSAQFTTITEPTAELVVTNIANVKSWATAGGGFVQGWKWRFDVTVPNDENYFFMKFKDWTNGASGVIPVNGNIRYYTAQGDHNVDAPVLVDGNNYPTTPIILNSDLDSSSAGKQIQVYVEVQVPEGLAGGSYSTSYQVKSEKLIPA